VRAGEGKLRQGLQEGGLISLLLEAETTSEARACPGLCI
jgi:hypothetical protein